MRKRILHLITTLNVGGAEMHLLLLVKSLVETGDYDITVEFFKKFPESCSLVTDFESLRAEIVDLKMWSRFDISALMRLYQLIKNGNFQILHTHLFRSDIFGLIIETGVLGMFMLIFAEICVFISIIKLRKNSSKVAKSFFPYALAMHLALIIVASNYIYPTHLWIWFIWTLPISASVFLPHYEFNLNTSRAFYMGN